MLAHITLLLVALRPCDAARIGALLADASVRLPEVPVLRLSCVTELSEAAVALHNEPSDAILLALPDPSVDPLSELRKAQRVAPHLPIILLNGHSDEPTALQALRAGAADYLALPHLDSERLIRAVCHATSRGSLQNQLAASDQRYQRLVEQLPDLIYRYRLVEPRGFEYVSSAAIQLTGYTPEEHYADPDLGLKMIHPDDQGLFQAMTFDQAARQQSVVLRWIKKDGSIIWTEQHNHYVYDRAGNLVAIEGVTRDITERRIAEELLYLQGAALEATANAIVITDARGIIQWVNPAYTRLTGYDASDVIGNQPRLLKSGLQSSRFYQQLWQTILTGQVWHGELVNRRKDGSFYHEEQTITPVCDPHGQVVNFIAIKQDISARKCAEHAAISRLAELEALNQLLLTVRSAQSESEILQAVLDATLDALQYHEGAIWHYDPAQANLHLVEVRGTRLHPASHLALDTGVIGQFFQGGAVCLLPHSVATSPALLAEPLLPSGWYAYATPLADPDVTGVLLVAAPLNQSLNAEQTQLVSSLAAIGGAAIHRLRLHQQTTRRLEQLQALRTIDRAIVTSRDVPTTMATLLDQVVSRLGVDAAGMLLFNPATLSLEYAAGRGFYTRVYEQSHLRLGEGLAGRAALEQQLVQATTEGSLRALARQNLLSNEGFLSYLGVPLVVRGQLKGVLEVFARRTLQPDAEWLDFFETFAGQAAIALDNLQLFEGLQRSHTELMLAYDTTIEGWARALDLRDNETEGHSRRVTSMTLRLAQAAGLSGEDLVHVRRGALLHDIGKMGIPDAILLKPGPLNAEEWAIMRRHPTYAYELLAPISYLRSALAIPYCHHEKWDGTGYPRGLKGEQIPLAARLFAVVDVWDALSSNRPYRAGWPTEQVYAYLREQAGTHFDPEAVRLFFALLEDQA
ncbi:MAG: HD domain-containing phosphohydrolase [Oscillochloridaceae bacterium umkhey_bin13]